MKTNLTKSPSFLIICLLLFTFNNVSAQCIGETLLLNNPSFEDSPSKGAAPAGWVACQSGQSPDIQPGSFMINLAPSEGNTYVGLYFLDTVIHPNIGTWQEGLSQQLPSPLISGMEYHTSIDLANSTTTDACLEPGCAELEIWGGFNACEQTELLWHSGNIANYDFWVNYPVVFKSTANYTFLSIQIKGLGCSGMPYILVDNFAPLEPHYKIDLNLSANSDTVCPGSQVILLAEAFNGVGGYNYTWNTSLSSDSTISIIPVNTQLISVFATDSTGCVSLPSTLSIHTFENIKLKYSIKAVCEGAEAELYLIGSGGTGVYQFMLNELNLTGEVIKFIPEKDKKYTVSMWDGCQMITDTLIINIHPIPAISFSFSSVSESQIAFNDQSTIKSGTVKDWLWSFGDGTTNVDQHPVHIFNESGLFQVNLVVTSNEGCKSLSAGQTITIQLQDKTIGNNADSYTNQPVSGVENPDGVSIKGVSTLNVFNLSGKKVGEIINPGINYLQAIRTLPIISGTYIYQVINNGNLIASGKALMIK